MDRQIVYAGSIPLDTDLLTAQRNTMVALGALAQCVLGLGGIADGLACTPTLPASLTIIVGAGSLTTLTNVDAAPFGALGIALQPLVKTGINLNQTVFTLAPPITSGLAINYLIEANVTELDGGPVVLPYYNAANPTQPFTGPLNAGTAQNTQRNQRVQLQAKPGAAASIGQQTLPAIDAGWVGLYAITVAYGQSAIDVISIAVLPGAPFLQFKLPQLTPGFSRKAVFAASANWTVPNGVTLVRGKVVGAGGGGGGGGPSYSGGGGGAGGYADGTFVVAPGQVIAISVGAGGSGSLPGSTGGSGGSSAFGGMLMATGGQGGGSFDPNSQGGQGGTGSGAPGASADLFQFGGYGTDGFPSGASAAGAGGASAMGGGGRGASGGGVAANGQASGSGAGGAYGANAPGGVGASGLVIVEY